MTALDREKARTVLFGFGLHHELDEDDVARLLDRLVKECMIEDPRIVALRALLDEDETILWVKDVRAILDEPTS